MIILLASTNCPTCFPQRFCFQYRLTNYIMCRLSKALPWWTGSQSSTIRLYKLTSLPPIYKAIDFVENACGNLYSELKALSSNILSFFEKTDTNVETNKKIIFIFICNQLMLLPNPSYQSGKQYEAYLISEALNLHLQSRNVYRSLRSILVFRHKQTCCQLFGTFGSVGDASKGVQVIKDASSVLGNVHQKFSFISADEFNFNQYTPAFVTRLAPVYNLKHKFLVQLLLIVASFIHDAGDFVTVAVTENLKSFKKSIHETYTPNSFYTIEYLITNEFFSSFVTMYDTTQQMKILRNKWMTEERYPRVCGFWKKNL